MPNFLGWVAGVFVGAVIVLMVFIALALPVPPALAAIPGAVGAATSLAALVPGGSLASAGVALAVVLYVWAYLFATASIAASLPPVTFPLASNAPTPTAAPVLIASPPGELFARGFMVGMTAALNWSLLALLPPPLNLFLSAWAFVVISLAAAGPVALNRVYQGFLGWSAWLFPVSYPATAVGLLLFLLNAIPAAAAGGGLRVFRIDWTTGVLETAGGITGVTGFVGGFSLGNFNFLTPTAGQPAFTAPTLSSHETGHTLNTAALGGVVLWINAVDENLFPKRLNLAYGELTAESHTMGLPGTPRSTFFVRIWG